MARRKKAMDFSSLDLNLDALGDWGGDEEKAEKEFIRAAKLNLSPVTWDNAEAQRTRWTTTKIILRS